MYTFEKDFTVSSGSRLAGGCKELRGECLFITGFITWETKQNAKVVAISSNSCMPKIGLPRWCSRVHLRCRYSNFILKSSTVPSQNKHTHGR